LAWKERFMVSLTISKCFRVGAGRTGLDVDLPIVSVKSNGKSSHLCANLSSSFRGILRKSVHGFLESTGLSERPGYVGVEDSLFGSAPQIGYGQTKEGKLLIRLSNDAEEAELQTGKRTGVRVDFAFGSVVREALFTYEYLTNEKGSIKLSFTVSPSYPLTDEESTALLAGINSLRYCGYGGFASRGMGIIEDVKIDEGFLRHSTPLLKAALTEDAS